MSMRPLAVCCLALVVGAEDIVAPPPSPDPTAAVVAEGRFVYRQRDLDALIAIAKRHSNGTVSRAEEDQIRQALIAAMPAREALLQALALLPASLPGPARDRLVLDLLDYQADLRPPRALTPETAAPDSATTPPPPDSGETAAVATPTDAAAAPAPASAVSAPSDGPLIVRLPQLILPRTLDGLGERTMTMSLAFTFADGTLAKTLETQAPLIQDAVLGYLHNLDPASFAKPNQPELKAGIGAAIRAKVPDFPEDAVLIPELDVSIPDKTKNP